MQCIILAGGLATRMRPLTETIPKSLLPVGNRPFIDYQLRWMAEHGVTRVVLCIGHLGSRIQDFVGTGEAWGLRVTFVDEGQTRRGTGGAVRLALDKGTLEESFLLTYGDSFLPIDFQQVWESFRNHRGAALMTVSRNLGKWDANNARFQSGWVTLYDKFKQADGLDFIDYGLAAMKRQTIADGIPADVPYDLGHLYQSLSVEGRLAGFEVSERFYEVGSPAGLNDFSQYIESGALAGKRPPTRRSVAAECESKSR